MITAFRLAFVLLLCNSTWHLAWSETDKTIVDLETGRSTVSTPYYRPTGAHRYSYDKTEVDLEKSSLLQQSVTKPQDTGHSTPPPATEPPSQGAPAQTPLPGGGR